MSAKNEISLISVDYTLEALGIRNLSAALKREGFNTKLIIMPKSPQISYENSYSPLTLDSVYELVKDSMLVGISCMSFSQNLAIQLINHLKQFSVPLVWGGINATIRPDKCLDYADIICIGEGEKTIVELARKVSAGEAIEDIPGMWVRVKGQVHMNEVPALIEPLDHLAFSDYSFENEFILDERTQKVERVNPAFLRSHLDDVSVVLARGCPHRCTYCYNDVFRSLYKGKGNWIRYNSIEYCIEFLGYLKSRLPGLNNIQIVDDNFLARPKDKILRFCEEYREKIRLPFSIYASPQTFDEDKMRMLMDSGMDKITVGIQTGSAFVNREIYRRRQDNAAIIKMAKALNKYRNRVYVRYDFLALNPYERESDILETLDLMSRLPKPYYASLNELDFYPGSELTKKALQDRLIDNDDRVTTFNIVIEEGLIRLKNNFREAENRYLNFIYCLTKGLHSRLMLGAIPVFLLDILVSKPVLKIVHRLPKKTLNGCLDAVIGVLINKYLLRNIYRLAVKSRGKILELRIKFSRKIIYPGLISKSI